MPNRDRPDTENGVGRPQASIATGAASAAGPLRGTGPRLCCAFGVAGGLFLAGFGVFVLSLERRERVPPVHTDGIVALTGGAERVADAIDLLARGYGGRLLITGVNERTSRERIAELSPGQRDLVACCVDLDYRARNTVGNAAEISRWAREKGFRSLIVVTSNYHLPRTLTELDHALPEVRKVPYAVVPNGRSGEGWGASAARARLLLSEYVKFMAVWLRTRLPSGDPAPPPGGTRAPAGAAEARATLLAAADRAR